jgi:predicted nuclease of predicted toxin-antitoxin system
MRFLADMGVSPRTVDWLRSQGHDAIRLNEEGLHRLPDPQVMDKALKEKRILLTMDLGFGALLAMSKSHFPSVILFRLSDETSKAINERLGEILGLFEQELENGAIISVNDEVVRVRSLPL